MNEKLFPGDVRSFGSFCRNISVLALGLAALTQTGVAQIVEVGGIARNFTVTDHRTGQPIRLYDYAGKVLVMDFFAYWCGPCQASSPDLKSNVDDYYQARGGNAHGVPVSVLSVNIESQNPSATEAFINAFGLHLVADDYTSSAYNEFSTGFIPLFVIINGVNGTSRYGQWEVLYRDSGYPGAINIRTIVDSVDPSNPTGPASIRTHPVTQGGRVGGSATLEVAASGAPPLNYQWFKNETTIGGNTNKLVMIPLSMKDRGSYRVRVTNGFGNQLSAPASVLVYEPGVVSTLASTNIPKNIPDNSPAGVTSIVQVVEDWDVARLGVQANITHTWAGDVEVALISPSGTSVTLIPATGNPGTQLLVSQTDVRAFIGQRARGTWTLRVSDLAASDIGRLNSWSLTVEHPPDGLSYQDWAAGYPTINLSNPAADTDGDRVPNFMEFLLNGASPQTADRAPSLEVDPQDPNYFQYVVPLRPNIDRALLSIQVAPSLGNNAWTEAVSNGDTVIVDKSEPDVVKLKLKRSVGMYVRLKGVRL